MTETDGIVMAVFNYGDSRATCVGRPQRATGAVHRCVLAYALLGLAGLASAQSLWQVTPYRVQVWVVVQDHPNLVSWQRAEICERLETALRANVRAAWDLSVKTAPESLGYRVTQGGKDYAVEAFVKEQGAEVEDLDKLFLLHVSVNPEGYRVEARELDVRARLFSDPVRRDTTVRRYVVSVGVDAILEAFAPLAMVVKVKESQVDVVARAGKLAAGPRNPVAIGSGAYLKPVVIRKDRYGKPRPESTRVIPWTYLEVQQQVGSRIETRLHSGFRQPLNLKRSRRVDEIAFLVRPRYQASILKMQDRGNPKRPLVGYEIVSQDQDGKPGPRLGQSDGAGRVTLQRGDSAFQLITVRHGVRALATLPILVGHSREQAILLQNDDDRLEVEGFVRGLQDRIVDLVAQRQVMAQRIRSRINAGRLDEATQLVAQLRRMGSRSDLLQMVQERQRQLAGANREIQMRYIDQLFIETRELLERYLDPLLPQQLQSEITVARRAASDAAT